MYSDPTERRLTRNPRFSKMKRFNVDSPSFTPSILSGNGTASKKSTISPKAASAAPFQPRVAASRMPSDPEPWTSPLTGKGSNTSTPTMRQDLGNAEWTVAEAQEFVPGGFDAAHVVGPSLLPFVYLLSLLPIFPSSFFHPPSFFSLSNFLQCLVPLPVKSCIHLSEA